MNCNLLDVSVHFQSGRISGDSLMIAAELQLSGLRYPPPPSQLYKTGPESYSSAATLMRHSYFIINITHTHSLEMKMLRIAQNMIPPPIPQPVRMDIVVNVSSFNYHYFYRIYILLKINIQVEKIKSLPKANLACEVHANWVWKMFAWDPHYTVCVCLSWLKKC